MSRSIIAQEKEYHRTWSPASDSTSTNRHILIYKTKIITTYTVIMKAKWDNIY